MDLRKMLPLVVYDDRCYLCIRFARIVGALAKGRVGLAGHYSKTGVYLREKILDSSALEMFWFIDGDAAYGGRAALLPLIRAILFAKNTRRRPATSDEMCGAGCKTVKSVFLRSASLLSHSKTIRIGQV